MLSVPLDLYDQRGWRIVDGHMTASKLDRVLVASLKERDMDLPLKHLQPHSVYFLNEDLDEWFLKQRADYENWVRLRLEYEECQVVFAPRPKTFWLDFDREDLALLFKLTWG